MRRQHLWSGVAVPLVALATWGASPAVAQNSGFQGRLIDLTFAPDNTERAKAIAENLASFAGPGTVQADIFQRIPSADLAGSGGAPSQFGDDHLYPGGLAVPGDGNNFIVELMADVTIPAGTWQIAFGSDDGGFLTIPGVSFTDEGNEQGYARNLTTGDDTIWYNAPRGQAWTGGTFTVGSSTNTTLRHLFFENGGGDVTEIAIRDASGGNAALGSNDDFDPGQWTLLSDGALGWGVKTDASDDPTRYIHGRDVAGTQTVSASIVPTETMLIEGPGLFMEVFVGPPIYSTSGAWNNFLAGGPTPDASGLVPRINWDEGDDLMGYTEALPIVEALDPSADPENSNFSNYSVRLTGEILIPQNGDIRFTEGTDDYAYFAVDTNGDGDMEVLIDDNQWTNWDSRTDDANAKGALITTMFSNVEAGGSWRQMEFRMSEAGGDDNASLFWDQNPGVSGFPTDPDDAANEDMLVPTDNFRFSGEQILEGDWVADFDGGVFEIFIDERNWDRLAFPENNSGIINNRRLDVDGAVFTIDVQGGTPNEGDTFDLVVNANFDEIVGTPTFNFLQGGDWDTSQFTTTGQITFLGDDGDGIPGDFNGNGLVEQEDLDLVLANWGDPAASAPATWVNDLPEGNIDQTELDKVLVNWGNTAGLGTAAGVPEPSTAVLLLAVAAMALMFFKRNGEATMKRLGFSRAAAVLAAVAVLGTSAAWAQNSGFRGRLLDTTIAPGDTAGALSLIDRGVASAGQIQTDVAQRIPVADLFGNVAGLFGEDHPYPGGEAVPGDGNNFTVELTADVFIPAGDWTITFGSDDGGMIQIPGVTFTQFSNNQGKPSFFGNDTIWFNNPRGQAWTSGSFTVPAGGLNTTFRHVFYENGGGDVTEIAITNEAGAGAVPDPGTWALLEDGALGWDVKTSATDSVVNVDTPLTGGGAVAGHYNIGTHVVGGVLIPTQVETQPVQQGAFYRVWADRTINSSGAWATFLADLPEADGEGVEDVILWSHTGGDVLGIGYPQTLVDAFNEQASPPPNPHSANAGQYPIADQIAHNEEVYSVQVTGEILIPENGEIFFRDTNDDYAYFAVDQDGDGVIRGNEVLIDDNAWTGNEGNNADAPNGGSPVATAQFSNIEGSGSWRKYEFRMAEGTGGDNAGLFWGGEGTGGLIHPDFPDFPVEEPDLVPADHLRTNQEKVLAYERQARFSDGVFEVDMEELNWDRLTMVRGNPDIVEKTSLDIDGARFIIDVLRGDLTPGFTLDLIDNRAIDEVTGSPDLEFVNTNPADWDTSAFATTGQLTFQAAAALEGDFNANGSVDQSDLDLVIGNWGHIGAERPGGWFGIGPDDIVDQGELDAVLRNWGSALSLGTAGVPEPSAVVLLLIALGAGCGLLRRKR